MLKHHREILDEIIRKSGKATKHTFLDGYLGNDHPRYPINNPTMRTIASTFMRANKAMTAKELTTLLTSLIEAPSCTEKCMAGLLLGYATKEQRDFHPKIFDKWLDHLIGWVEVDTLCTGTYPRKQVLLQWGEFQPLLEKFSKSKNIQKRRASLALLVSPVSESNDVRLATQALQNVERLKGEKEILITKAISWILRSMIKHHREMVDEYVRDNEATLPRIAVRETNVKLTTGRKTKPRP